MDYLMDTYSCPVCQKTVNFRTIKEKGFQLKKCPECNLVFTYPQPVNDVITKNYKENYFLHLAEKERLQIEENRKRMKLIEKYIGQRKSILDVGCGTGLFLSLISSGNEITGVELFQEAVEIARKKLGDKIFLGELETINFPSNHFDVVTFIHTIEHVKNPESILKESHRLLKPNGFLIMETPNRNFLFRLPFGYAQPSPSEHLFQFNSENLEKFLKNIGFKILKSGFLPPTLMVSSRGIAEYSRSKAAYFISKLLNFNISDNILVVAEKN